MCGLAGVLHLDDLRTPQPDVLRRMVGTLRHRGPDGQGLYLDRGVGLAHARLSIIDLEGGAQPIHNEDRTVWTVFNGEVFNYLELREELRRLGHRFLTDTDTEVLVHAYEAFGDDFVHRLNGQFAFALWDSRRHRLLLVRDRPGILPLFIHNDGRRLVFASEVKALLPALDESPRLDPHALDQIFTFWAPLTPRTVFKGVEEIRPGEMLVAERGQVTRRRYWNWSFPAAGEHRTGDEDELAGELLHLLADATRIRLRSDVPVGSYLSGGLDSSAITALVHSFGDVGLRTFSITFDRADLDESVHQQIMVRHLGAEHTTVLASRGEIGRSFPDVIRHTEIPVLRAAPAPMRILSGLARRTGFKVVLTGEGADEVLGGYDLFKEAKIRQFWARHPDSAFRASLLRRLYPYLDLGQRQGIAYLKQFFGQSLDAPDSSFFSHLPRWSTTSRLKEFYSDDFRELLRDSAEDALAQALPPDIGRWHPFNRAQYLEATTLMAGYLLCSQGDRMLMSNSVEGRFPFLDHRVMEFASLLHPRYKMRALNEKALLKRALAPYLPQPILDRHKQPYRAPDIESFFPEEGPPDYVEELLSRNALRSTGCFDDARVEHLLRKIRAGRAIGAKDNMALVGILSTQLWHAIFVTGVSDFT